LAFRNEVNLGPVRNWLLCVERASGEIGKILWSDDLIARDFLERTLPLLRNDVGFVYTGVKIFTGNNPDSGVINYLTKKTGIYSTSKFIDESLYDKEVPVSPGCALFRLSDIEKNLLLNVPNKVGSDFSMHAIGNDLLLFLLTANKYKSVAFIAEPISFFRAHEGSISISSTSGKLILHYTMAKAYFVENFMPDKLGRFSVHVKSVLARNSDSKSYGLNNVNDFFSKPIQVSKFYSLVSYMRSQLSKLRQLVRQ
jgi:hypothetical protein